MMIRTNRPPKTREQIIKEKRQQAMVDNFFDCLKILGGILGFIAVIMAIGIEGSIKLERPFAEAILPTVIVAIAAISLIFSRKIICFVFDARNELLFLLIVFGIFGLILAVL